VAVRVIDGVQRKLNWKRQPADLRDLELHHRQVMMKHLPAAASTRAIAEPPIRDQGSLGSCTQNAGAEAMGFLWMKVRHQPDPLFSRLFGYWFTRHLEGNSPDDDSGCNVRDVFKAYTRWGLCLESTWPYDISKFSWMPSAEAQQEALKHQALKYFACKSLYAIKQSIADGYPVIFGFDCFESLESPATARTGIIPMPGAHERSIGGHCMLADSYDDATRMISGPNSWGEGWGDHGRFQLPYDYWERNLASDAHTLRLEE
jgi:C1A family cysteine protease